MEDERDTLVDSPESPKAELADSGEPLPEPESPEQLAEPETKREKGAVTGSYWRKTLLPDLRRALNNPDDSNTEDHHHAKEKLLLWMDTHCCASWPVPCTFFLGVVIPLWILVMISLVFGHSLARLEAPGEVEDNNHLLASREEALYIAYAWGNFTTALPAMCLSEYLAQQNGVPSNAESVRQTFLADLRDQTALPTKVVDLLATNELVLVNLTGLSEFMEACRNYAKPIVEALYNEVRDAAFGASGELSFNWIRCYNESELHGPIPPTATAPPIDAQKQYYTTAWKNDQQELYAKYLEENLQSNMTLDYAKGDALNRSAADATGESACLTNEPASAWFWFTIMATVGYGNKALGTSGGRIMMYTIGFASLLLFGMILARAGETTSAIFDQVCKRLDWNILKKPFIVCLIWGISYYSWMLVIAAGIKRWKETQVGVSFSFRDGYWFSFISTTTLGLGDIYLEPEVIRSIDLYTKTLSLLVGFTLFSSFLGNLSQAIAGTSNKKGFYEVMLDRVKETHPVAEDTTVAGPSDLTSEKPSGEETGPSDMTNQNPSPEEAGPSDMTNENPSPSPEEAGLLSMTSAIPSADEDGPSMMASGIPSADEAGPTNEVLAV